MRTTVLAAIAAIALAIAGWSYAERNDALRQLNEAAAIRDGAVEKARSAVAKLNEGSATLDKLKSDLEAALKSRSEIEGRLTALAEEMGMKSSATEATAGEALEQLKSAFAYEKEARKVAEQAVAAAKAALEAAPLSSAASPAAAPAPQAETPATPEPATDGSSLILPLEDGKPVAADAKPEPIEETGSTSLPSGPPGSVRGPE